MEINKVHHGNCLELIKQLPTQSVDLCLTDPPYGVGFEYKTFVDDKENLRFLVYHLMPELFRVCKTVVVTPGTKNMWLYPEPTWTMAWHVPSGAGCNVWGFTCWHPILVYGKDPYTANSMGSRPDVITHIENSEQNGHPCPKPINLWRKLLLRCSVKETDLVLDPFMGSGTTAIACMKEGRNWIGFELEEDYIKICEERIKKETAKPTLFQNAATSGEGSRAKKCLNRYDVH